MRSSRPRAMSEKQRAFHALRGDVFPRVGDRGIFSEGFEHIDAVFADDNQRTVEVVMMSATGKTIWTRFVHPKGQERFGMGLPTHRWLRSENMIYWGGGTYAPVGELRFR